MLVPISFSKKEVILDMCCGTGGATYHISKKATEGSIIVGIDLSLGQLKHAKKRNYFCDVEFIGLNASKKFRRQHICKP